MATLSEAIEAALAHQQAGRFPQAEKIYRQVLQQNPRHVDAWQLLGLVAHQSGRNEAAVEYISRAIALGGVRPELYNNLGSAHQALGRYEEAANSFREAIRLRPDFAVGHHNLGDALRRLGRPAEAAVSYRETLRLQPDWELAYNGLGHALSALGQSEEAVESYRQAVRFRPNYHEACNSLGNLLAKLGRSHEAIAAYRQALSIQPNFAEAHSNLGTVLQHLGLLDEAVTHYRQALVIRPGYADAHCNLGAALLAQERYEESLINLQAAVRLHPMLAEAHSNVAAVLQHLGRPAEAVASCRRALEICPGMVAVHVNLGGSLKSLGRLAEAEASFREAIRIAPDAAGAYTALGTVLKDQGRLDEAEAACRESIRLEPGLADSHNNLGNVLQEQARTEEARACFEHALRLQPKSGLKIKHALIMPVILESIDEIERCRARLAENLRQLALEQLVVPDPTTEVGMTAFHLAYHGPNNRALQASIAELYRRVAPVLNFVAPHCSSRASSADGRVRVGFLSKFFFDHPVGKHYAGFIKHLSRERFHVTVLRLPSPEDAVAREIVHSADRVVTLTSTLQSAQQAIAGEQLDALIYTDIGMDPFTYFLSFARLAPVQCVLTGHPDTTGIPTIDYFISGRDMEAPGAEAHYTERLVQLTHLPSCYELPQLTTPRPSRASFGLSDHVHLYVCAQTLFKIHPDFDGYLGGILQADPLAEVVLFSDRQRHWSRPLQDRMRRTIGNDLTRVRFLPRQSLDQFRHLLTLADAVLDTIHFNGGTTTFDALAVGAPVVTEPGPFARGRTTLGCYRQMGVMDCVARDRNKYIEIAVRLATDGAWREEIRRRIAEKRAVLYGNPAVVLELEEFLLSAVAASG